MPDSPDSVPRALGHLRVSLQDSYLRVARQVGLTAQQAELLCAALQPAAVGRLAETLRCDRTNITHLVERAAARRWVDRVVDEQDRRSTLITLTPEGERLAREFISRLEAQLQPLLDAWSDHRQRSTAALLHDLANELDRASSAAQEGPSPTAPIRGNTTSTQAARRR